MLSDQCEPQRKLDASENKVFGQTSAQLYTGRQRRVTV